MAYSYKNSKGVTYYLHATVRELGSGKKVTLYYFAKSVNKEKALKAVPKDRQVVESKNGLPLLKKK